MLVLPQGSSEYNITVLVDQADSERALRAVHSRFYMSEVSQWEQAQNGVKHHETCISLLPVAQHVHRHTKLALQKLRVGWLHINALALVRTQGLMLGWLLCLAAICLLRGAAAIPLASCTAALTRIVCIACLQVAMGIALVGPGLIGATLLEQLQEQVRHPFASLDYVHVVKSLKGIMVVNK